MYGHQGERSTSGTPVPAGLGSGQPASLREADLPLLGGDGPARDDGAQLLGGRADEVPAPQARTGASGAGRGGPLQGCSGGAGGEGERRPGGAGGGVAPEGPAGLAGPFERSCQLFEQVVGFLGGAEAASMTHAELEDRLSADAREVFRQLFQDHVDLRAE